MLFFSLPGMEKWQSKVQQTWTEPLRFLADNMFQLGLCIDKSKNHGGGTSDHEENKRLPSFPMIMLCIIFDIRREPRNRKPNSQRTKKAPFFGRTAYASNGLMALDGHDRNHALDELFPSVTLVAKPCRSQEATGPEFW